MDWTVKGGTIRGQPPLEDYFILGMDVNPTNLLRGHQVSDHGRNGQGPMGSDFVLTNFDIERRIFTLPFFNSFNVPFVIVKAEVFFDTAKTWDRTDVFKDSKLLMDTGAGLKFETPTSTFNVAYGRSLRDGRSIFYGYVERRLWW